MNIEDLINDYINEEYEYGMPNPRQLKILFYYYYLVVNIVKILLLKVEL